MKKFFNTLVQRLKSETPRFFKKIRAFALSVAISLAAVLTVNAQLNLTLPDNILTYIKYGIAICVAIAGTSQLTTTNNYLSEK